MLRVMVEAVPLHMTHVTSGTERMVTSDFQACLSSRERALITLSYGKEYPSPIVGGLG
jgi:hypothetical protein